MFRISILMCGARNGGSVMSTRLWCSYMVESAVVLGEKGRQDALWGEGWGGVVGLGRYLGDSVPFAVGRHMCISP